MKTFTLEQLKDITKENICFYENEGKTIFVSGAIVGHVENTVIPLLEKGLYQFVEVARNEVPGELNYRIRIKREHKILEY